MTDRYGNKRLNATIDKYDGKLEKLDEPLYLDAYNQNIREDGVYGCIRCGESYRNMSFIIEPIRAAARERERERESSAGAQAVTFLNAAQNNISRCIRSNYWKMSPANAIHQDGRACTMIVEIYDS